MVVCSGQGYKRCAKQKKKTFGTPLERFRPLPSARVRYTCFLNCADVETVERGDISEDFARDTAYPVHRVIDGDTIKIEYKGKLVSVRFIGVDTPETVHPTKPVQRFGPESSAFTTSLLDGKRVDLRFGEELEDKYGRLLAYVYRAPDGMFVNLEIVRQGYGHAYVKYPFEHMDLFRHYEARARQSGKGLWSEASTAAAPDVKSEGKSESAPDADVDADETVYVTKSLNQAKNTIGRAVDGGI